MVRVAVAGIKVLVSVGGTSVAVSVAVAVSDLVGVKKGVYVTVGVHVSVTVAVGDAEGEMMAVGNKGGGALVNVTVDV
jgi:hypothetical protein